MNATWIVSANAGRARLFSHMHSAANLEEVEDMVNTSARLRAADLETDDIGQRSASKSKHSVGAPTQPSGYEPDQSPVERQTELFARNIADYLLKAHQEGRFQQLNLVASPEFLGVLRKLLDPQLESVVTLEIDKDYTQFSPAQLLQQIKTLEKKS